MAYNGAMLNDASRANLTWEDINEAAEIKNNPPVTKNESDLLEFSYFSSYLKAEIGAASQYQLDSSVAETAWSPFVSMNKLAKRSIDIIIASVIILLFSPLFMMVPLIIMLSDGKPVFFKSYRQIKKKKEILIYKFRSMVKDAESEKYRLTEKYMRGGYLDIPLTAEVYTPVGRLLERSQLVEIPQIFNVLSGQMSLVGNRPLPRKNVEILKQNHGWQERFRSPAGLSGITQVVGKFNLSTKERLTLESMYSSVYNQGNIILCDLYILIRTIFLVVFSKPLSVEKAKKFLIRCGGRQPRWLC